MHAVQIVAVFTKFLIYRQTSCLPNVAIATISTLVFLTPRLLPACHNVNRFVASFLAPLLYFLHFVYRVDGVEIKDIAVIISSNVAINVAWVGIEPATPRA